jgi:uncharacterized protein involved in exopolysaccharide biosynthesis
MTKMTDEQQQIDNDEISLKELIQKIQEWITYLKTQWKIIIGIAALGGIIGFVYASFQKPNFQAELSFIIEEDKNSSNVGGALGIASSFGLDISTSSGLFAGSNIFELIKSRLMIEKTLLNEVEVNGIKTNFANLFLSFNAIKSSQKANIKIPLNTDRTKFNLDQNIVLQTIAEKLIEENIEITQRDKKNNITYLTIKSENEFFAKSFCEELIKETSNFYIETKSNKARKNVEILENQTDSIRKELYKSISGLAYSKDNVFNLNRSLSIKLTSGSNKEIDVKANTEILTQLITQLELSKVNLRKETPLVQLIDLPQFPLKYKKIGKIKASLVFSLITLILTISTLVLNRLYINFTIHKK